MTLEQAQDIKKWRIAEGYTWRSVAQTFTEKYEKEVTNNQWVGISSCDDAMKLLGETVEDGWN